jgi:membrane fusion protein (multidrug efflux system)
MKIGRILFAVFLVVLIAFIAFRARENIKAKKLAASEPAPEKIVPVESVQPSRMDILDKIHASANIQADSEITIFSKVSGKIAENLVKLSSPVRAGQVVAIVNRDEIGYDYKPFEVKSDAKGVVSKLMLNPGATVNPNIPLMTLVDIDTVKAIAAVDENRIRFIKIGQAATVGLEAYPGETFSARVTNISTVANPLNRTVDVELSIPNPDHRIKPGMYAEVEWISGRRSALVVPIVSLVERTGEKFVFLVDGGQARLKSIAIGAVVGDVIEIVSGLKGDEKVVTTGAGQLNDGDKIKVIERKAAQTSGALQP